ncbi:glycine zipper 2TM domain-containing protein [Altericroceibacterium xinjiangense]|uniref:glycine zipper 2TM domain-containing protein n=1 Tax=Altericroceibacterium xinjiangense TaxID=762261 RepID=UPI000F7ED60A|nr:glycine zipper 2TM domain-containing protein [Altericroceibacterium xinjiangense]
MRNTLLGIAAASLLVPALPVTAGSPRWAPVPKNRIQKSQMYDSQGRYYEPRRISSDQVWRGRDGQYYCRREDGKTGLIVGGVAGVLAGRAVDTAGDRTTGTVLGAAAGALSGQEAEKQLRCR